MQLNQSQQTPARLNKLTTYQIPRWILFAIVIPYLIAGLYFRDVWKSDDAVGVVTALSLFRGDTPDWLFTYIGHYAYPKEGPLFSWVGSLLIYVFSPVFSLFTDDEVESVILSVRLSNFLYLFLILWLIRKSTKILAERRECRPLKLPFGGEPALLEYSRTLADCAFLFVLAMVGIIVHMHSSGPVPLLLACNSIGFYGLTRLFARPRTAALFIIVGLVSSFLARGLIGVVPLLLTCLVCLMYNQINTKRKLLLLGCIIVSVAIGGGWLWLAWTKNSWWTESWIHWNLSAYGSNILLHSLASVRDLLWFTWPAWPFALLALWNWRYWLRAPHIFLPLLFVVANIVNICLMPDAFEIEYSPIVVPTAILAAMSIPTIRRDIINALDWFSIMIISMTILGIWFAWIAFHSGYPAFLHHNINKLLRGYNDSASFWTVLVGVLATAAWLRLLYWRLSLTPKAVWRGIMLAAAGLTCAWVLFLSLWLTAFDYHRSYKTLARDAVAMYQNSAEPGECIKPLGMGEGQRALFYLYGELEFADDSQYCNWVLIQTKKDVLEYLSPYLQNSHLIWADNRDSDRHGEIFQLRRLPYSK